MRWVPREMDWRTAKPVAAPATVSDRYLLTGMIHYTRFGGRLAT